MTLARKMRKLHTLLFAIQHRIERPKKGSVISKHRKWLADLQKQKDSLELQYISEMAQKKETHDKVKSLITTKMTIKSDQLLNLHADQTCLRFYSLLNMSRS